MARRTRDGLNIRNVVRAAEQVNGITVRDGTNHVHILNHPELRPCPIAGSTNVRRMVVPWIRQIVDYSSQDIYAALRRGEWD
tara:strand:- start:140 stop:385 length:246 start_codon:yes stop_codon:yes gene_type:complete